MKEIYKNIWYSKLTILLILIQVIVPIIYGKKFWSMSFIVSIIINMLAMLLINCSIKWLQKKGEEISAEDYKRNAPCIFQALKFSLSIFIMTMFAILSLYIRMEWINVWHIIVSWYILPLVLVFVASAFLDAGYYDAKGKAEKINKFFAGIKRFLFIMFDIDENGKLIFSFRSIFNTIALVVMIGIVLLYYYITFS